MPRWRDGGNDAVPDGFCAQRPLADWRHRRQERFVWPWAVEPFGGDEFFRSW